MWERGSDLARSKKKRKKISRASNLRSRLQVGAHGLREVCLVDYEQVGLRDARPSLARHLISPSNVDHVDDVVCQLPAIVCGEVVLKSSSWPSLLL